MRAQPAGGGLDHDGPAALTTAVLQTVMGMLPAFLLGAMSVQVRADIGLDAGHLGRAVMAFFLVSGAVYAVAGSSVERLGTVRATWVGAGFATLSLIGVAVAPSPSWVTFALVVGGPGNAVSQLAANLRLSDAIPATRQGIAFGTKQGAVPLAAFFGGLAVPAVALTVGWRVAFFAGAAMLLPVSVLNRPRTRDPGTSAERPALGQLGNARRHLWAIAVAAGLGTAATNVLAVFYVDAVVLGGTSPAAAGLLLAGGSIAGAGIRVVVGRSADRRTGRHLVVVAAMLAVSAAGYAALALPPRGWMLAAVTALTFTTGWGWNGLLTYAVVRFNPAAPARATGITQAGVSVGGALGPVAAGHVAAGGSYALVWCGLRRGCPIAAGLVGCIRHRMIALAASRPPPVWEGRR